MAASSRPRTSGVRLEFERDRAVGCEADLAQTVAEAHRPPLPAIKRIAGSTKVGDSPSDAIKRPAGFPAAAERPAQERAREQGRAFFRLGVEAGEQQRPPQALVERALATHRALDRRAGGRPEEGERREIFLQRRPRRPPLPVEQPPGRASLIGAQPPAFARSKIGEVEERERRDRTADRTSRSARDNPARPGCRTG